MPGAWANSVPSPTPDELAAAELVIEGEISSVRYETGADIPYSEYTVSLLSVLRGAPPASISVVLPGAVLADGRVVDAGAPGLVLGERVLLFLEARSMGGYRLVHLTAGILRQVVDEGGNPSAVDGVGARVNGAGCTGSLEEEAGATWDLVLDSWVECVTAAEVVR